MLTKEVSEAAPRGLELAASAQPMTMIQVVDFLGPDIVIARTAFDAHADVSDKITLWAAYTALRESTGVEFVLTDIVSQEKAQAARSFCMTYDDFIVLFCRLRREARPEQPEKKNEPPIESTLRPLRTTKQTSNADTDAHAPPLSVPLSWADQKDAMRRQRLRVLQNREPANATGESAAACKASSVKAPRPAQVRSPRRFHLHKPTLSAQLADERDMFQLLHLCESLRTRLHGLLKYQRQPKANAAGAAAQGGEEENEEGEGDGGRRTHHRARPYLQTLLHRHHLFGAGSRRRIHLSKRSGLVLHRRLGTFR